jgi:hypothetical protein
MPMELSSLVRKSGDQVSCSLNDDVAILNLDSALYFGLEGVGAEIWQALSEPRRVSELCGFVAEGFEVEKAQCQTDVLAFLSELEEAGLVEIVQPSASER